MTEEKKRGGRPRKGSLYWTKSGWRARLTVDIDGVSVQKSFDLETTDKQVARIKLRRLVHANQAPPEQLAEEAARVETFREAAERIVGESMIRTKKTRLDRLRLHAFPSIGPKLVTEIVAGDVRDILNELADRGFSKQQCLHVRNDISAVLGELWRADILPENVCRKVRLPKHARVDRRERAVLTDAELLQYLGWVHPQPSKQDAVRERQTMAVLSRVFGGLRWGDIRALRWENFETTDGRFSKGWAPRKKTARPQALAVPEVLRPFLRDWWERHGRPHAGLMFPARTGKRAGEERLPSSIAKKLRVDLRRAFGVDVPRPVEIRRSNGRADTRIEWVQARPLTDRERELFEETEFTRPVDFHSFRRQFKQALADANVDVQQAMALSGATDLSAHQRYLSNTGKVREIPAAALPSFSMAAAETPSLPAAPDAKTSLFDAVSECRRSDLNRRPHAYETTSRHRALSFHGVFGVAPVSSGSKPCEPDALMQKPHAETPGWVRRAADAALAAYLGEMALGLAGRIVS